MVVLILCFHSSAYITSLHGDIQKNLEKISGFHEWQAVRLVACLFARNDQSVLLDANYLELLQFTGSSKSYLDLFKKESLVYLTADSPNTITKLSRDKVYIIGGIVDRNRLKGITYQKAVEQGIETAKLPLDTVVEMGSATRVLTVNHGTSLCILASNHEMVLMLTQCATPQFLKF